AVSHEETIPIATQIEENVTCEGKSQNFSIGEGFGLRDEPQIEVRRSSRPKSQLVRDVRFYETVFPFKMQDLSKEKYVTDDTSTEVDWLGVFDTITSQSTNDEEGRLLKRMVRRSSRPKSQPVRFNDYVVSSNVKYGLEKLKDYRINGYIESSIKLLVKLIDIRLGWLLKGLVKGKSDVNNAFLYGDLNEEVYMALSLGYSDKNETKSKNDYSLYVKSKKGLFVALLVYVDDIVIIGSYLTEIESFKRKYCLELLSEYDLLACKPVATPLQQNAILCFEETKRDKFLPSMSKYQKHCGKLIYLSVTRPDIAYVVHCLSHHMHALLQSHFNVGLRVLRYSKQAPGTGVQFNRGLRVLRYLKHAPGTGVQFNRVRWLISLAISKNWPMFLLDVNNAFLYGDLNEEVYMALPRGYYEKNKTKSKNDYSLYVKSKKGLFVALLVYADDIVITGSDLTEIESFKSIMAAVTINSLDAGNPLFLHNNDHSNLSIVGFKLIGSENYKIWSTTMKIAFKGKNKMGFIDEFDILSLLLTCTYAAHEGLLKHNQLDAFAVVSREESHMRLAPGKITAKTNPIAFVAKTNNGNNNFNNNIRVTSNNNSNRGPNPNPVCKHCGLIRHTNERCYELNGYLAGFKRNTNLSKQSGCLMLLSLINKKPAANVTGSIAYSKYFVGFDESKCYIQDLRLGKIVKTGSETAGLYMFDCANNGKTFAGLCNYGIVCFVSKELWHCRLGHPTDQVLSVLSDQTSFKTGHHVSACDICHKVKHTREFFSLSDHKAVKLGELIHLDVWGAYKVTSGDGYK
nr:ribonuclease H-like domain-containing protein [Tanacetum cinerariifolium]